MSTLLATEGYVDRKITEAVAPKVSPIGTQDTELATNTLDDDGAETNLPAGKWKYSMYSMQESNGVRVVVWGYSKEGTPRIYPLQQRVAQTSLNITLPTQLRQTAKEIILGSNTLISFTKQNKAKIYQGTLNLELPDMKLKLFVGPNVEADTVFNGCFVIEGFIPEATLQ